MLPGFLDLPEELKLLVYRRYYETQELTLKAISNGKNSNDGVTYTGLPSLNLELVNCEVRRDAMKTKEKYLPKTLNIDCTLCRGQVPDVFLPSPEFTLLSNHIEEVRMIAGTREFYCHTSWPAFLRSFPKAERLLLEIYALTDQHSMFDQMIAFCTGLNPFPMLSQSMTELFNENDLRKLLEKFGRNLLVEFRYHVDQPHPDPRANHVFRRHQVVSSRHSGCRGAFLILSVSAGHQEEYAEREIMAKSC